MGTLPTMARPFGIAGTAPVVDACFTLSSQRSVFIRSASVIFRYQSRTSESSLTNGKTIEKKKRMSASSQSPCLPSSITPTKTE